MVDTGCSQSILSRGFLRGAVVTSENVTVTMMNGEQVKCGKADGVELRYDGMTAYLQCLVSDVLPGFDVLLGMDLIKRFGGVDIGKNGDVRFHGSGRSEFRKCVEQRQGERTTAAGLRSQENEAKLIEIDDPDFSAVFQNGTWTVKWKWKDGKEPALRNRIAEYSMKETIRQDYERELCRWIDEGWLKPYNGPVHGLLPLLAVLQENKGKVRPVMDYREVNQFVSSHTGESVVCGEKLREWRKKGTEVKMVDLKNAYLQIQLDKEMWKYQVVKFRGRQYCLTRLGFGLNAASKIMNTIFSKVLSMDPGVARATDSYIDDIIVDDSVLKAEIVVQHLAMFGLEAKEPEPLDGGRILGLRVSKGRNGVMEWRRDNVVGKVEAKLTKRQLFVQCGQLVGHFPRAGWLRPACSFVKRLANDVEWDESVSERVQSMASEIANRVGSDDPVRGVWSVRNTNEGIVWCDASSLAEGVVLEIGGVVVEDASWLRRTDDTSHINLSELQSVIKGLNMALSWNLRQIRVKTDSATVFNWLQALLTDIKRIKVKGLGEALAKRRLGLIRDLVSECSLTVAVDLVKSAENKADELTRVPQKWLIQRASCSAGVTQPHTMRDVIIREHRLHHFGVDRTLFLLRKSHPTMTFRREEISDVIRNCGECQSIDPAPVRWNHGTLDMSRNWLRLACDVTHYKGKAFLTIIDCGPSRFCIWRELGGEHASEITGQILSVFREFGPPQSLLLDNGTSFRSQTFAEMCKNWNVAVEFRCAYRPSGNGIVERVHRTVKCMAERAGASVLDIVYWLNMVPNANEKVPSEQIFRHKWRHRDTKTIKNFLDGSQPKFQIGQNVFVRPGDARCTSRWNKGIITRVLNDIKFEVDGIPRHVSDLRPRRQDDDSRKIERVHQPNRNAITIETEVESATDHGEAEEEAQGDTEIRTEPTRRNPPRHARGFFETRTDLVPTPDEEY